MATRTTRKPQPGPAAVPGRYLVSLEQFMRMGETGILGEDEHVELIRGELIQMAAVGDRHIACVDALTMEFGRQVYGRAVVSVQNPVRLPPDSAPEPDIVLYRLAGGSALRATHEAAEVLLMVEVADTSLGYDLSTKAGLYAERGIPELWVWDLPHRGVHVFRGLRDGRYEERFTAQPGDILEVVLIPGVHISVSEVLGPQ